MAKTKKATTLMTSVSHFTAIGTREYQEDRLICRKFPFGFLLAVFDGHGGSETAVECAKNLPQVFKKDFALMTATGNIDYGALLRGVIEKINEPVLGNESGSTVSMVFIPETKGEITAHIAVIGDSPVVITDRNNNTVIGPNHNVRQNLAERQAAINRGGVYDGWYIFHPDDSWCGLQMSRDLGNAPLSSILSHEPDVISVPLGKQSIVIVSSDGVFDPGHSSDTLSEAERFIDMIRNGAKAKDLVHDALARQTGDNATAIVLKIGQGSK